MPPAQRAMEDLSPAEPMISIQNGSFRWGAAPIKEEEEEEEEEEEDSEGEKIEGQDARKGGHDEAAPGEDNRSRSASCEWPPRWCSNRVVSF